jgi:hypothetical protein
VTYGDSLFVAVGYNGTILTSPDGTTWTLTHTDSSTWLESVTYGNEQFVAVGYNGEILTSPDGTTWTLNISNKQALLRSVTYGDSLFVAVGDNGKILTSKADNSGVEFQPGVKPNISGFKIIIANKSISAMLPYAISCRQLKVGLFNVAGKRIYSATTGTQNGILKIPAKGFPAGKYLMSITDENKRTLGSSFVLMR